MPRVRSVMISLMALAVVGSVFFGGDDPSRKGTLWADDPRNPEVTLLSIAEIQGAGHRSPHVGSVVRTTGVVTAINLNSKKEAIGFYLQSPKGDGRDDTSDGLVVFTKTPPAVRVGHEVSVSGRVDEFGFDGGLSITQLIDPMVKILSRGNPLPKPVLIGAGGRKPPTEAISDPNLARFDPVTDGMDFYESLEGMRVRVNNPRIVGRTEYGEIIVLSDAEVTNATARGGVYIEPTDYNPERIFIDNTLSERSDAEIPSVDVGDQFEEPIEGIISYSFENYKLLNPEPLPPIRRGNLAPERTTLRSDHDHLTIASYNVLNLDLNDEDGDRDLADGQFDRIARHITENLGSPDIIALQEIQDDNGSRGGDTVSADRTLFGLAVTIFKNGGPNYRHFDIPPRPRADGGQPGGNIRVAYLYDPERVELVERGGAGSDDETQIVGTGETVRLSLSPVRVSPRHPAFGSDRSRNFAGTRKSLAAEFRFNGVPIFVINNHLKSKRGDNALFGSVQPPGLASVAQRKAQAGVINRFVKKLLTASPKARIVVLGDLNDFPFSEPVRTLAGKELVNLSEKLPLAERYTYVYQGNSQQLDHILVSPSLADHAEFDAVHVNAEFGPPKAASDHDPIIARFRITPDD